MEVIVEKRFEATPEQRMTARRTRECQVPGCGGKVAIFRCGEEGYEVVCQKCNFLYDED